MVPELILAEDVGDVAEEINLQIEQFDTDACEAFVDKNELITRSRRHGQNMHLSCTLNEIVDHRVAGILVTRRNSSSSSSVLWIGTIWTRYIGDSSTMSVRVRPLLLLLVPSLLLRMRLLVEFGFVLFDGRNGVGQSES